jgi:hypothetical protein
VGLDICWCCGSGDRRAGALLGGGIGLMSDGAVAVVIVVLVLSSVEASACRGRRGLLLLRQ